MILHLIKVGNTNHKKFTFWLAFKEIDDCLYRSKSVMRPEIIHIASKRRLRN
mgnify:CR=1 FL=1